MAGVEDLLGLPSANGQAKPVSIGRSSQRKQSAGGMLDSIVSSYSSIEDPMSREIMRQFASANLSQALGFRIDLPTEQDLAMQETAAAARLQTVQITAAKQQVQIAKAAVMSLDPQVLQMAGVSGKDMDSLIESNPQLFLDLANREARVGLSLFDLNLGGADTVVTDDEARDRAVEQQGRDVTVAKQTEEIAKRSIPQAAAQFGAIKEQFGEQGDVNLGSGMLSDIDTAKGSELFAASVGQTLDSTTFSKSLMADAILADSGSNIKDQLEGLGTDEEGRLVVGAGDGGVDDEASFFLTASTMRLAGAKGVLTSDIFREMSLGYAGVNIESFLMSAHMVAEQKGMTDGELLQATLGGDGFLQLAREAQAAGLSAGGA